jgi:predicted dehydrogenase
MGRIDSAANFIQAIEGSAAPLNNAGEALKLMRIIDAIYQSAAAGAPVAL